MQSTRKPACEQKSTPDIFDVGGWVVMLFVKMVEIDVVEYVQLVGVAESLILMWHYCSRCVELRKGHVMF